MKGLEMVRVLLILAILLLVGMAGCLRTTAGPFVTDISFDGDGNLIVTKNMIHYNTVNATLSNGENPQTIVIKTAIKEPTSTK